MQVVAAYHFVPYLNHVVGSGSGEGILTKALCPKRVNGSQAGLGKWIKENFSLREDRYLGVVKLGTGPLT